MIQSLGNYFLYRHVRLDTNEVFYIGIGSKPINCSTYRREDERAYKKNPRSKFWKNITRITEYTIEILLESNDFEFIKQKEKEFIALYGRRSSGLGTLVNLTNGGDGTVGYKHSDISRNRMSIAKKQTPPEVREKIAQQMKGRKLSEEHKRKISESQKGKTIPLKQRLQRSVSQIGELNHMFGKRGKLNSCSKSVIQYTLDWKFIKEWGSMGEIERTLGFTDASISAACRSKSNHSKGYKWRYASEVHLASSSP